MTLSLDTNLLIDVINRAKPTLRDRFLDALAGEEPVIVSTIVLHELLFGAAISARPELQRAKVREVLSGIPVLPWTEADAEGTAFVRASLKGKGQSIGALDGLIAGQALARGWTVVTANTDEFDRVEGLNVIDWSKSPA